MVYFPPLSGPGCGKCELSRNKPEGGGQGFAALAKPSPWPGVPLVGGGSRAQPRQLAEGLCTLLPAVGRYVRDSSSPLAVPAQAVPSTPRHTAVTQPGAALSKQMLKRRSCSDLKCSCQSFGPTDVSPVHRGPCTLHRQSKRLKTRLNQNIEINICLLGGMLGLAH